MLSSIAPPSIFMALSFGTHSVFSNVRSIQIISVITMPFNEMSHWLFLLHWRIRRPSRLYPDGLLSLFDDIRQVWLLVSESLYLIHDQPKPQNNTWSKNVFPEEVVTHAVILYFWFLWPVHKHVLRDTSLKDAFSHLSYTAGTFALLLPVPSFPYSHNLIYTFLSAFVYSCPVFLK